MAHAAADRRTSGGLIDGVDAFDSLFFSIAPSEAATMDPQQRLFLQTAYHAMEDAGHTTRTLGRNVSVHVASMGPDYAVLNADAALRGGSRYPNSDLYQLANRVSYFFDFTGPSIAVDTACSGSGVALKLACDTLRSGSASAAIAMRRQPHPASGAPSSVHGTGHDLSDGPVLSRLARVPTAWSPAKASAPSCSGR